MIAHVAAVGEQRGRVVLHLASGHPNQIALAAAIRVAKAFQSEVESLFVEDQNLYACADYPFAVEISLSGRTRRALSTAHIAREFRHAAAAISRQLDKLAREAEVPLRRTVVCDDPVRALARACAECGPWNLIALGDTVGTNVNDEIRRLFDAVSDTTGVIVTGPRARRTTGPLVVVLEDIAHLEPMLRTAERLAPQEGDTAITLLLVADSHDKAAWMEGQVRLVLGASQTPQLERAVVEPGGEAVLAELLRRLRGGLVIAEFGGALLPAGGDLRYLTSSLECPLLLMR